MLGFFNPAAALCRVGKWHFQWPITWGPLGLRRSGFLHLKALCQAQAVGALICGVGVIPEAGRSPQNPNILTRHLMVECGNCPQLHISTP